MTALQTAVLDLADARDFAFAGGKAVNLAELARRGLPGARRLLRGHPGLRAGRRRPPGIAARARRPGPDLPARARAALLATPIPDDVAAAVTAAYLALGDGGAGRGAVVGHGRGPPGRELRGPAGHLPQRGRRRRRARRGAPLLGVALDGPGRGLPRRRGHPARGHPARGGGAADGRRAGRGRAVHRRPDQRSAQPQRARRRAGPGRRRRLRRGRPRPLGGRRARDHRQGPAAGGCLTDRQVRDLVELGRRVEAHFGAPQDIEWALDGDGHAVAHPVARDHHALPGAAAATGRACASTSTPRLAQGLTRPITPMGLSAFRVVGASLAELATGRPVDPMARPRGVRGRGRPGVHRHHRGAAQPGRPQGRARHLRRDGGAFGGRRPRAARGRAVAGAHPFGVAGGLGVRPARPADPAPLPGARAHRAGRSRVRPPPARWSPRAATSCARAWPSRSPATGTPGSRTS